MISCTRCQAQIADGSKFCSECGFQLAPLPPHPYDIYCSQCGQRLVKNRPSASATDGPADPAFTRESVQAAVPENVAAMLSYLFFWVSGVVFFLTDKRRLVRFHAAQSIVVFGTLSILEFVTLRLARNAFLDERWYSPLWFLAASVVGFVAIAFWLFLMLAAYEGKPLRVPVAAGVAEYLLHERKISGGHSDVRKP
jgi:uncharacterized membrane protein